MRLTKLTFLLLLLAAKQLIAQNDIARWAFTDSSEMQAIRFYHAATGNNARIYTGLLRQNYSLQIQGRPYFDTSVYMPANVVYQKLQYENIPVLYDMFTQTLITLLPGNMGVQLLPDKTSTFDIGQHHFIRLDSGNAILPKAPSGFYEILLQGKKISAYVHRKVIIEEKITDRLEQKFVSVDKYYLTRNGQVDTYTSWRGLPKLLGITRGRMRRQLAANGIDPKLNPDMAIRAILQYYDDQNPATP